MLPDPLFGHVHMYGIMIAVGILFAFLVLYLYGKKMSVDPSFLDFIFYDGIVAIMAGMGSAALFQAVYDYIDNPSAGFHFNGGITFIGGLIGGALVFIIGYFLFRRRLKGRLIDVLSILPCCIVIAHAFGRIGCFFAGCCYGKPTDSFLGVKFPNLPEPVHPTQLYESAFLFALFALLSYMLLKKKYRHNMSLYLVMYGVFRFLIEFIRGDYRGKLIAGLSPSQFWSIAMILFGIGLYFGVRTVDRKSCAAKAECAAGETEALCADDAETGNAEATAVSAEKAADGVKTESSAEQADEKAAEKAETFEQTDEKAAEKAETAEKTEQK